MAALVFGAPGVARAEEPIAAKEPRLMSETSEITSVVDAFDKDDPFDLNLMVGIRQSFYNANIRRETTLSQPGLTTGGFTARTENVAAYSQQDTVLDFGADIGIYRDLALIFRMPVYLSDTRSLSDLNGSAGVANQRLADPVNGQQLFNVPFNSPSRSGLDYFSVGADYAIFNQQRDDTKPTWVVGAEGRFAIGTSLHACNKDHAPGTPQCPNPNGTAGDRDPGMSRGFWGVGAHTVFSRRYGYVEPYMGFWFLAEFPRPIGSSDFGDTNDLKGALVNHPPLLGTFGTGLEVVPYENREEFRRFVADFRVDGIYHSAGREYSELFDALGSSQAPSLRSPNPGAYTAGPNGTSVQDTNAQQVFFTGITDQQAYASVATRASATFQAGDHIKFTAGVGFTWNQSHLITAADPCNPNFTDNASAAGPCHVASSGGQQITGIPNPNSRPVIDAPGRRFSVDDGTIVDLWFRAIFMF
jgi:hypothetical protein